MSIALTFCTSCLDVSSCTATSAGARLARIPDTCQMRNISFKLPASCPTAMLVRLGKRKKELNPARSPSSSITKSYPGPCLVRFSVQATVALRDLVALSQIQHASPDSCMHDNLSAEQSPQVKCNILLISLWYKTAIINDQLPSQGLRRARLPAPDDHPPGGLTL